MANRRQMRISPPSFNLPSDPRDYPQFGSLHERQEYILDGLLEIFMEKLQDHLEADMEITPFWPLADEATTDVEDIVDESEPLSPMYEPPPTSEQEMEESRERTRFDGHRGLFATSVFLGIQNHMTLQERMEPHMRMLNIYFVGDCVAEGADMFTPSRGDLIIAHPGGRRPGLPDSVGYLASYLGPSCHKFSNKDLLIKAGSLQRDFARDRTGCHVLYDPFSKLELYMYDIHLYGRGVSKWRYLGSQGDLTRAVISPCSSTGKHVQVGTPVLRSEQSTALVPRRGDLIIKGECWIENFDHSQNFWHSMIKWYRGNEVACSGDMLIRRFVDSNPQSWGWAELYRFEGSFVGWVFWGRTLHCLDTLFPPRSPYMITYACDDGKNPEAVPDDDPYDRELSYDSDSQST